MLPLDTNLKQAYVNGTDDEQKFIQNLAMFLSIFLKEHGHLLEKKVGVIISHIYHILWYKKIVLIISILRHEAVWLPIKGLILSL